MTGLHKAAFPYWDGRIAPLFDTARQIQIVHVESRRILRETQETLVEALPIHRAMRLLELEIETLVCGGVSRNLHAVIASYGIQVIPFVAGDLDEVIQAWLCGDVELNNFAMPGCHRRGGGRFRGMHGNNKEANRMNERDRGTGAGGGKGQGRGSGGGRGRMGGRTAGGPAGNCVCPQCGHSEPHQRGLPCAAQKCPKCGSLMTRQ